MLAESVQGGEVEGGAEACADNGWESAAPELTEGIRPTGDIAERVEQGGGVGLLDSSLKEVDGLKERGRDDAGTEASDEVECCTVVSMCSNRLC